MSIKVRIPTPLQKFTNGKTEVECAAKNIADLVDALEKDYPGMKDVFPRAARSGGSSTSM